MKNKSLMAAIAVLSLMAVVSLTAYTQVDSVYAVSVEERIAKLVGQIQEQTDRITALESKKNGTNDLSIDVRIDVIRQQITDKQAIIESLRATPAVNRITQIIEIQNQLNDAVNEINRLTTIILQLQTSLHSLIVLDSTPVTVSEPVEINELESYIIVNGTQFGLGDTVGITVKFNKDLHLNAPVNLRGEVLNYTDYYIIYVIHNDNLCTTYFINGNVTYMERDDDDPLECVFNDDGSIFVTWLIDGDMIAGKYVIQAQHEVRWMDVSGGRIDQTEVSFLLR